ncbi:LuxR family transcriptional regulator [Gordonia sp. NB41Y]|uniref:helix-turn-helix transcriptional regulator n=1 Tax=Gordonia sp. NB41Y TaxID=875808 RepID=UPI001364A851|nr:LuxR family transcriptional regulator [Gordonia sp. NB41Y]WLP91000.1 LuxR C-terminal-related transcriptional regulator [Gordonia sp. NB41Y]
MSERSGALLAERSRPDVVAGLRESLLTALETRRGTSIVIEGPPGIGKSHLISTLLADVYLGVPEPATSDRGAPIVLRSRGDERRRTEAFSVVTALMGGVAPDIHPGEYVLERIDDLAATGPVLVWVDDAHNADEASLTVLRRLVWTSQVLPLIVIVSARPIPGRTRLDSLVEQADIAIRLPPLTPEMVRQIVTDMVGGAPGPALTRAVSIAQGNPLFVCELVRAWQQAGALRSTTGLEGAGVELDDEARVVRPGHLDRVVRDHLGGLDDATRDVLATLAVCGTRVSLELLAELMFYDPADLDIPLAHADRAGMVTLRTEGELTVDFAHDVFREVAYDGLSQGFRRATHHRLARLAEQRGMSAAVVAGHRIRAGGGRDRTDRHPGTDDTALILDVLRTAVAEAEELAPEVAADLLEMAETQAGTADADRMLVHRVHNLIRAGRGPVAERLIRTRIDTVADPRIAARLQAELVRALVSRADADGAVAMIDRALSIGGLPRGVRDTMTIRRAWIRQLAGHVVGDDEIPSGVADFAGTDPQAAEARATQLVLRSSQALFGGAPGRAVALLAELDTAGARAASGSSGSSIADDLAPVYRLWATLAHSGPIAVVERVDRIRHRSGGEFRWSDSYLGFLCGDARAAEAEWDDAVAEFDTALESAAETGTGWISIAVGNRAYLDAHRGDVARARSRLDAFRHRGLPLQFGIDYPGVAELAALEADGDLDRAAVLVRSLWAAARIRPGRGFADRVLDIARTARLTGQERLVRQIADDLADDLRMARSGSRGPEPTVRLQATAACVTAMAVGDVTALVAAADLFGSQAWGWPAAQVREEAACAAASAGDRARALSLLDEALAVYEYCGARLDRDRALARVRALGVRRGSRESHRSATSGWEALTATETRVVGLVCEGLTNKEIGARMFVSPRTVQTHVSHILTKTGLRSRVEVATAAREQQT